jgi:hypothetical protein
MQNSPVNSFGVQGVSANSPPPQNSVSPGSEKKLSPLDLTSPSAHLVSKPRNGDSPSILERWVNRIAMLLFVTFCAILGVLLFILPWTPKWTDNYLLISYPALRDFLENGFVRGMCSGLGALDIWIGFSEATQYHEKENRL